MRLRAYAFERYRTRRKEGEEAPKTADVTLAVGDEPAAKKALKGRDALAEGVILARDLVNEPPNVLFPQSFAERAETLTDLGVDVEVLDVKAMKKLGMGALLGVGQGSKHDGRGRRDAVERRQGPKGQADRLRRQGRHLRHRRHLDQAVGASMEDMKGDMGGAAAVVGLMHALAARKAKANVVGAIGLVENMPDGNAQRPGDIVTSMSGQTIEIINTDAEGRLVLADVLWYVAGPVQAAVHGRPRDADRRHHGRARPGACRPVLERRRARRERLHDGGHGTPARRSGGCRSGRNTTR